MANTIFQLRRSSVSGKQPNTSTLSIGELGINITDQKLYSTNGSVVFEIGSNVVNQRITNSLTIDNDKRLYFQTVNTSVYAALVQQSDDNFVFYTSNSSYGTRAVYSIYANSNSSEFSFQTPVRFNANVTVLSANGTQGSPGQYLTSNGSTVYWSSPGVASVNTAAQWTWTNTHTFQANVSFTGNGIGLTTNTSAIYLGGIADANWKIGRNTGVVTKWKYTNNTIDIVTANSNLEGMTIGLVNGNSYFETGYLGTFIAGNVTIGNTSSNATINSTSFSGTANNSNYAFGKSESGLNVNNSLTSNNASYLGGTAAANFVQNTDSRTLSGNLVFSGANVAFTGNATFSGGVYANGSLGTANQVLTTNGTAVYWSNTSGGGGATAVRQQYTGNGSNTVFTVTTGYTATQLDVYVNGVKYYNGTEVDVSDGSTISFTNAPPNGSLIEVVGISDTLSYPSNYVTNNYSGTLSGQINFSNTLTFSNTVTTGAISANGSVGTAGQVLASNGTATYWTSLVGVDANAQYAFTNTISFSNTVSFGSNVTVNTSTIFLGNSSVNTNITAGLITINGSNVVTTATALKVYYANNSLAYP